jgi:hypothetical protein
MERGLFFILILFSQISFAQIYNSSIVSATAGSGRAAVDVGDPSFLNPATLVHLRGRTFLLSAAKDEFAVATSENNPDTIFPAALSYVQRKFDGAGDPVMHDIRLTLAEKMGVKWGFGMTPHYYQLRYNEEVFNQTNADVGLIYTPNQNWGLGFVAYDVGGPKEEMPEALRLQKRTGLGANYLYGKIMRFRLDTLSAPNNNFSLLTTSGGYEIYFNEWVIGRLGYQDDRFNDTRSASLGFGLDLPKFDVNYAFVSELPRNENERHSIDLTLSF